MRGGGTPEDWRSKRRRRANVRTPANPSLDEGYSLLVRALGHFSGVIAELGAPGMSGSKRRAISLAIDHCYAAEDLLKPLRGGYVR
jgi:hypothetical protein